jgi:hypothetical protein
MGDRAAVSNTPPIPNPIVLKAVSRSQGITNTITA